MKKTMNKSNSWIKYLFFVIIIAAVFVGIAFASIYLLKDNKKTNQPLSNVHTNEKSIDNYGINCDDNDTKLYKEEFEEAMKNKAEAICDNIMSKEELMSMYSQIARDEEESTNNRLRAAD